MSREVEKLFTEYNQILNYQIFNESDLDYRILDNHIRMLEQLDVIASSSISIFDLFKKDHVYFSKKFESVFGWDLDVARSEGAAYANRRIHPDDMVPMLKAGNHFLRFAFDIVPESRKDYKVLQEYRIEWKNHKWVRVVEQMMILETDKHGNIWLGMGLMDLSPDQNLVAPYRSRVINCQTGEVSTFRPEESTAASPQLTKRESKVLQKIAEGKISKEIADELFISVHTVNTHRQRILEKFGVGSSIEAINYATRLGLFD